MNVSEQKIKDILEIVLFLKDRMVSVEGRLTGVEEKLTGVEGRLTGVEERLTGVEEKLELTRMELKRDIHGLVNRLDNELDKRKALEVRVGRLEARKA